MKEGRPLVAYAVALAAALSVESPFMHVDAIKVCQLHSLDFKLAPARSGSSHSHEHVGVIGRHHQPCAMLLHGFTRQQALCQYLGHHEVDSLHSPLPAAWMHDKCAMLLETCAVALPVMKLHGTADVAATYCILTVLQHQ